MENVSENEDVNVDPLGQHGEKPRKSGQPTVLFIGGYGRMGSTLLDRLVGQHPDVFSAGEIRHFWDRAVRDDQLCECRNPFSVCDFWSVVVDHEFGNLDSLKSERPWELWESVDRLSTVPGVLRRSRVSPGRVERYVDLVRRVIHATAVEAGTSVIVDSSKYPVHGMMLGLVPDIDLRIIHLVRDPRAVAYSWQRTKHRPEIHWEQSYIRKRSLFESSAAWSASSFLMEANRRSDVPQINVRYEDLMRWPQRTLDLVWRFVGLEPVKDLVANEAATLLPGHTIAGNPSRFQSGNIRLRADEEWRESLSTKEKMLVSAITLPGLLAYQYGLSS